MPGQGVAAACLALVTVASMGIAAQTAASSLVLSSPAQLAGAWLIYREGDEAQRCELTLVEKNASIQDDQGCLTALLGQTAHGWSSRPEGIALTDAEEATLILLARRSETRYQGRGPRGVVLWLERAPG